MFKKQREIYYMDHYLTPIYLSSICNRTAFAWMDKTLGHKDVFNLFDGPGGLLYDINEDPEATHYTMCMQTTLRGDVPDKELLDDETGPYEFIMDMTFQFHIQNGFDGTAEVIDVGSNASFLMVQLTIVHENAGDDAPMSINYYKLYKPAVIAAFLDYITDESKKYCHPWELEKFLLSLDNEMPSRIAKKAKKTKKGSV